MFNTPVSAKTRYYLRYFLQIPSIYMPSGEKHIFLFSTRRSGSTLLRDMIYSQQGFNYIDQPFCINQHNPYIKKYPNVFDYKLTHIDAYRANIINTYLCKLLDRSYVLRSQWAFWQGNYHWIWERYVLKILNANGVMDWFLENYHEIAQLVFLMRHPIPVALSILHKGWDHSLITYLLNEYFVNACVTQKQKAFSMDVLRDGSDLEKYVLEWCLENLVPLRLIDEGKIPVYFFEDIVTQPEMTSRKICDDLHLEEPNEMVKIISNPRRTATPNSSREILTMGPESRVRAWESQIGDGELEKVQRILDCFDVKHYSAYNPYPYSPL